MPQPSMQPACCATAAAGYACTLQWLHFSAACLLRHSKAVSDDYIRDDNISDDYIRDLRRGAEPAACATVFSATARLYKLTLQQPPAIAKWPSLNVNSAIAFTKYQ